MKKYTYTETKDTRSGFGAGLIEAARENENIVGLCADLTGSLKMNAFENEFPERFFQVGISEANMMSMAAGMGLSGMRPVIYTITPFTTLRCLEQIRIGVAYHQSPVVIVGTGSGLSYSELGPTHHSLEDMAIIRTIPNINVLAPSDKVELIFQLREAIASPIPTYIRIGKKGEPNLGKLNNNYGIGKANILRDGKKYLLLGVGPIIGEALKASEMLELEGISLCVASMGGVSPLDVNFLSKMISENFTNWITLEEHGIVGGLGTSIIEWLSDSKNSKIIDLKRLGVPKQFINKLGNQEFTRNQLGLDAIGIKKEILEL